MSEISHSEAFGSKVQRVDLNALADALAAKGDLEEAERLREQAQMQTGIKQTENDSHTRWLEQKQREAQPPQKEPYIPGPLERTQRFDASFSDQLADALAKNGDLENAQAMREQAQRQRGTEEARQNQNQRRELVKARRLDPKELADALRKHGKLEHLEYFENMANKARLPLQRSMRPPETK